MCQSGCQRKDMTNLFDIFDEYRMRLTSCVIFYTIFKINIPGEWVSNITLVSLKHSICSTCPDKSKKYLHMKYDWKKKYYIVCLVKYAFAQEIFVGLKVLWARRFFDCFSNYKLPRLRICYSRLFMHPRPGWVSTLKL